MKNQYVGDIGDYGKYALLRALAVQPFCKSIGINWYLTPDDVNSSDGRFTEYLDDDSNSSLDNELFNILKEHIRPNGEEIKENRNVSFIQSSNLIPGAVYYDNVLDYSDISVNRAHRWQHRKDWINRSLDVLGNPDIIFLDPDNGLEVSSVSTTGSKGNKYVTYDEAWQYYDKANVALVIYNHRDRKAEDKYIERFLRFYEKEGSRDVYVTRLTFTKTSVRDYVFIVKGPENFIRIHDFINDYVKNGSAYFSKKPLPMPTVKRWALDEPPRVYSSEEWGKKTAIKENLKMNRECRLDLGGTIFRFFISSKGYDDGGDFWTDAVIAVENWCFNYKTSKSFLEFHELIYIRDKLSELLNNEIKAVEVLEFIEPDLQIILNPQRDLGDSGNIEDVSVDFKFTLFIGGALSDEYYVLPLYRRSITDLVSYMTAAIDLLS